MKKIICSLFAALSFGAATAAPSTTDNPFICSYYGEPISTNIAGFASSSEAAGTIATIIDAVGLQPKFQIRSANIPNAAAVVSSGQRYILYNPTFISTIEKATKTKWASIAILAHEIGHHLNGHTLLGAGSRRSIELEADEFSGFVLRKMGASLADAQVAMRVMASGVASSTHPAKGDRLQAIANGWYKSDAQITGKDAIVLKPIAVPSSSQPATKTKDFNPEPTSGKTLAVVFDRDPQSQYYITADHNLVKVSGAQLTVIAKLVATGKKAYPWMLYDGTKNYLLVDASGIILSPEGARLGAIGSKPI